MNVCVLIMPIQSDGHDAESSSASQMESLLHEGIEEELLLEELMQSMQVMSSPASQTVSLLHDGIEEELLLEEPLQSEGQFAASSSGTSHSISPQTGIFFLQIANE
jgi:hypothetical protein